DRAQLRVDDLLRARAGLAGEQHELGQARRRQGASLEGDETGLRDADDLVLQEWVELNALVRTRGADERELDAAGEQPFQDLVAGGDLDVDADAGVAAAEAPER